jgi:uncharacterized protein
MDREEIVTSVLKHHPKVQGIYLFGTFGTDLERPDSDLDLALLLPPTDAGKEINLAFGACHDELVELTGRNVDLINLRKANTVFQNEIINEGTLIYSAGEAEIDAFEMKVMSAYQKLNEERADILREIEVTGRVLQ